MAESKSDRVLNFGRRTFTTERIPVASALGRKLVFGEHSSAVVEAVREVAKNGNSVNKKFEK